jgi:hypothetical protein
MQRCSCGLGEKLDGLRSGDSVETAMLKEQRRITRPRGIRVKLYFLPKKEQVPTKYQVDDDLLDDAYDHPVIVLSIGARDGDEKETEKSRL